MNERFKELLKQSTNPPWDGEQGPMNEFNLEKCFELIVRECADIADLADENKCEWIGGNILTHFGVEE